MYRITQISKYNNITAYGYGQYGYFTDFSWYDMSLGKNLNINEFKCTDGW